MSLREMCLTPGNWIAAIAHSLERVQPIPTNITTNLLNP